MVRYLRLECMTTNRIEWIDIARGIAIIIVVAGHSLTPSLCAENRFFMATFFLINAVNMPIFFYISGKLTLLTHKSSIWNTLRKGIKKFLLPYFLYSIFVYMIIKLCAHIPFFVTLLRRAGYNDIPSISKSIYQILSIEFNIDKHLWFLCALFGVQMLDVIVEKIGKHTIRLLLVSVFSLAGFVGLYYVDAQNVIFKILYYYFFYTLGKYWANSLSYIWWKVLFFTSIIAYLIIEMYSGVCAGYLKVIVGIFSIPVYYSVAIAIKEIPMMRKLIQYIGQHSFPIYLWHQPFIVSGIVTVVLAFLHIPIVGIFLGISFGIVIPLCIDRIWSKTKLFVNARRVFFRIK